MKRLYHRLYAYIFGYFWLPCDLCGYGFGGHENHETLYTNWTGVTPDGTLVCSKCAEKAKELNKVFFETHENPYVAVIHEMVPVATMNGSTTICPDMGFTGIVATTYTVPPRLEWITREEWEQRQKNEANSQS